MKKPEILAPAGSMESLRAAVVAGCDAVYIGGSSFGARAYAENLSEEKLIEAIDFCHLHGVKIYLTVNTLFKEEERRTLLYEYLLPYYEAGLDAVIVQDVGVMDFVREYFPEIEIHASTQMALTMGRGADALKQYHVSRMVPARELSLKELQQMRKDTSLELEVFVHGALCYCYSGQCLFSSMLGGRSGNRGRCAQPCRMAYHGQGLSRKAGNYLLSPRELCNLQYIGELIEAGVDSFKIEGRMKRPEYTAFVTAIYRKYVDAYVSRGKQGYEKYLQTHAREWQQDLRYLAELYNRDGFTQGYLQGKAGNIQKRNPGRKGEMLSQMRPRHGGVLVGEVLSVGQREVVYRATEEIFPQDVVEFRDEMGRQSYEYTLGKKVSVGEKVTARYQRGCQIRKGDAVYRTRHGVLLENIRKEYLEKENQEPVQGVFTALEGQPMRLTVQKGNHVVCCQGEVCQAARKQPSTREMVKKSLSQTGNSLFYFQSLKLEMEENLFLSVGALKKLRRQALEELAGQVISEYRRKGKEFLSSDDGAEKEKNSSCDLNTENEKGESKAVITVSVMNLTQLRAVLEWDMVKRVYLATEEIPWNQIEDAFRQITQRGKEAYLVMPRIFRLGVWEMWENWWRMENSFLHLPWSGFLIRNWESLHFLREGDKAAPERIALDYHMYVMNEGSYHFWQRENIYQYTLPLELTGKELAKLSFLKESELVVYGRIPLMITAQCMLANTKQCICDEERVVEIPFEDERKRHFFSRNYCRYCYNVIYQQKALFLEEDKWRNQFTPGRVRYDFVNESPEEIRSILSGIRGVAFHEGHWLLGIE